MTTTRKARTTYRCARCGRRLRRGRWVYSRYTRARYCWPGEGCAR